MARPPVRAPRVCILTETYHPVVGGGERQAQALAGDLRARGFETMVLTRRSSPELARYEVVDGVPVHRIRPVGAGRWVRWAMMAWSLGALTRLRQQYDIVLVSGFKALGVSAVCTSRLFGKVCVLKADSNGEFSGAFFAAGLRRLRLAPGSIAFRMFLALRNAILRRADCFVAITADIGRELETGGIPPARIRTIANGVDVGRFHPVGGEVRGQLRRRLGLPALDVVLVYTGRLVTYKGVSRLVRVAERLARDPGGVHLVLLGSGGLDMHNCEAELRAYVEARALGPRVRLAGEVSNVAEYLQAADVFVLPTEDDALPLALIEAMACGLAVVSTRVGGIGDVIEDGQNGLLVAPGSDDDLYAGLRRLVTDPTLAAVLGRAATATVGRRYSRDRIAAEYADLLTDAAPVSA